MKTLYLECNMGAAGDMLTAALADLLPDRDAFAEQMNNIGMPELEFRFINKTLCGIRGCHAEVKICGEEEISNDVDTEGMDLEHKLGHAHHHEHSEAHHDEHNHHHDHGHDNHSHHHAGPAEIAEIVSRLDIPENVRRDVNGVYALIAEAEAAVHGTDVEKIHFHEIGMLDAICDVTAVCLLMNMLNPERVIVSPVCTGYGEVKCMHGIVPVPSPAVAYLIQGIPSYSGHIRGELLTPTGAALLKYYADEFTRSPVMTINKIGYGMGSKEFEAVNCVRAILGETNDVTTDEVIEISCNLDDMTGESIGFAADILRNEGALDVYYIPIQMKKDRPAVMLCCLCRTNEEKKFADLIMLHTTTLGVRINRMNRHILPRTFKTIETEFGPIDVKTAHLGKNVRYKPEFESTAKAAKEYGVSIDEVVRAVMRKML